MSDEVRPTLEDLTECWCGYKAVNAKDLTLHQLYCDPHNTAPKVIDDQRKRIVELEAQLAAKDARIIEKDIRITYLETQLAFAEGCAK